MTRTQLKGCKLAHVVRRKLESRDLTSLGMRHGPSFQSRENILLFHPIFYLHMRHEGSKKRVETIKFSVRVIDGSARILLKMLLEDHSHHT